MIANQHKTPTGIGSAASLSGAAVLIGIALLLGIPALAALFVTVVVVVDQDEWHWHYLAGSAALCCVAAFVVLIGVGDNPVGYHYSGYLAWLRAPSLSLGTLAAAVGPAVPLGVPAGVVLGACVVGIAETRAVGAEWHPLEQRRLAIGQGQLRAEVEALLADARAQRECSSIPLGVAKDGDLDGWREGRFAIVDPRLANLGLAVVGAPGTGKTVSIERLVEIFASRGRRVVVVDCKGTDPDLPERLVASYMNGANSAEITVHVFPDEPIAGWTGPSAAVANRLLVTQLASEPYYEAVLETAVRLAVSAPETESVGPCDSSTAFMARLSPEFLQSAFARSNRAGDVAALKRSPQLLDGVRLRFAGFFEALYGKFDGVRSYGDSDISILTLPTLAAKKDGEAAVRMLLADFSQFCVDPARKARRDRGVVFVIDEFSAVTNATPLVIDLAERLRDVGGQVIVASQSFEGLGNDIDERKRLLGALPGGLIIHRCAEPDELLRLAGTERKVEQSWQIEDTAHSGMGSMRMGFRMRVDPDQVRQASVGEAWAISGGRSLHMHVIQSSPVVYLAEARRLVAESKNRGSTPAGHGEAKDQTKSAPKLVEKPSFLDDLGDGSESGGGER